HLVRGQAFAGPTCAGRGLSSREDLYIRAADVNDQDCGRWWHVVIRSRHNHLGTPCSVCRMPPSVHSLPVVAHSAVYGCFCAILPVFLSSHRNTSAAVVLGSNHTHGGGPKLAGIEVLR